MNTLITGANGFVGNALTTYLRSKGSVVSPVVRKANKEGDIALGDIGLHEDWGKVLEGVDAVVHLAGRVHQMEDKEGIKKYREVNVKGTRKLAFEAVKSGVKRFIFLSTVKVNGEFTKEKAFTAEDVPSPSDPYAISKWEAEQELHMISQESGMEVVILRSPLVYGPGVKGNILRLLNLIYLGAPLPLAGIDNCRSMIGLGNLVDLLWSCLKKEAAAGETFLATDGSDFSTPELITRIASGLSCKPSLFRLPQYFLKVGAFILRKGEMLDRLNDSLVVSADKVKNVLGWKPKYSVAENMSEMSRWYLSSKVRTNG